MPIIPLSIIQLQSLSSRSSSIIKSESIGVCAIRAMNLSTEFKELDLLNNLDPRTFPLLPFILKPDISGQTEEEREMTEEEESDRKAQQRATELRIKETGMNQDQATVLREIIRVGLSPHPDPPIVLVHGVFGSGKSFALSVALRLLNDCIINMADETKASELQILFGLFTFIIMLIMNTIMACCAFF